MKTYNIEILNPKVQKLLQDLADLQLIKITTDDAKLDLIKFLDSKRKPKADITEEEISKEIESVREKRYAKKRA